MPKVFFIGDIVGRPGRAIVNNKLPLFRSEHGVDLVVANGENAAGGAGITASIAGELKKSGIDGITLGDHVWDQRDWANEIDQVDWCCKPANLPSRTPGRSFLILESESGFRLGVFTVLGRNFMKIDAAHPFETADRLLKQLKETEAVDGVLVEIHAEATSEKVGLGWYLDGRASLVVGTHTHIPTADTTVLPGGTAYLTDAGMTGPYASVLGRKTSDVLARFQDGMPRRFPVAEKDVRLCGLLVEIDAATGTSLSAERIELKAD